jgi:pimeloyl-ACP methyl ester carboxylesterase
MHVTTIDGLSINVEVDGPIDAPPVVLLHGVMLSSASWGWLVDELADRYRLLRVDLRGHGRSDRAPGRYDLPGFVADVRAVLTQAVDQPPVIVGHSLGGVVAAAVAQQDPAAVRGLLLEEPALLLAKPVLPDAAPPSGPLIDMFDQVRAQMPRVQAAGTPTARIAAMLRRAPTPFGVTISERYHDDVPDGWAASRMAFDVAVLDRFLDPPAENLGPGLDLDRPFGVPTTVLAADSASPNRVVGRGIEARITAADPHLLVHRVVGAGHNMHAERGGRATFTSVLVETLEAAWPGW